MKKSARLSPPNARHPLVIDRASVVDCTDLQPFAIQDLARLKREGGELDSAQIDWLISEYTADRISDAAMSALLMAICLRGLGPCELRAWTAAMVSSGPTYDLTLGSPMAVDKHSTGGIGDKITLILAPLFVACGGSIAQVAGRGLGFTGGTIDKLEAIPGWSGDLSESQAQAIMRMVGGVIMSASAEIAPADRKMYALRDATGTVESPSLIAASILSKKIASGNRRIVFDVKCGSGAFTKTLDDARALARLLVSGAELHDVVARALVTDMSLPLGRSIGNALEVEEAISTLRGGGPADVREVTLALAREMLALTNIDTDPSRALDTGAAFEVWQRMVSAQGGDLKAKLPEAAKRTIVQAQSSGYFRGIDAGLAGTVAWRLGTGRRAVGEPVSPGAGILILQDVGEWVETGDPILEMRAEREELLAWASTAVSPSGLVVSDPPPERRLILDVIQ